MCLKFSAIWSTHKTVHLMPDPNPNQPLPVPGLAPADSTKGAIVAAFIATTVIIVCHKFGIDFPAGYEASMAAAFTVLGSYILPNGRK